MQKFFYEAIFTPNELGGYDVSFPELGIITFGDTLQDAAFMAQDLLTTVLSSKLADGEVVNEVGTFTNKCPRGSILMGIATYASPEHVIDKTMTAQEAAIHLNVSRSRIYAMVRDGLLRAVKSGNNRLIDAEDVMRRCKEPRKAGRPKSATA